MKKGILSSLLVLMILGMVACGLKETAQQSGPQDNQTGQISAEDENGASDSTGEADAKEDMIDTAIEGPAYLDLILEKHWDNCFEDVSLMYAGYNSINLRTTEYPALTAAIQAFNEAYITETQGYIDQMEENARYDYAEFGADGFMGAYEYDSEMLVKRADDEVLSIEESIYSYEGGAHGVSFFKSYNFDVQTGAEIELDDVITDKDSLPGILTTEILEKYPDITYWTDTLEGTFQEYITPTNLEYVPEFTWTLGYDGVTFYFSNYEIGSYADGTQEVTVLYSEYPHILNEKYFVNVDKNYVIRIDRNWAGMDTDLNGDGVTDYISVTRNYNPELDFSESYNVTVNGNTFTQETYCYDLDTYLVKSGDNNYLYVQRTVENDYQSVCVFKITEISVEYMGEFSGGMGCFTNSADFEVARRMDLLSTYTAMAKCSVGEDGMPLEDGGIYRVKTELSITSVVEITAELTDGEGNLTGESFAFPAGTEFYFVETDGETFVDMKTSDGQFCRLYTTSEWPVTVNGMNAEESFEMLWYAG